MTNMSRLNDTTIQALRKLARLFNSCADAGTFAALRNLQTSPPAHLAMDEIMRACPPVVKPNPPAVDKSEALHDSESAIAYGNWETEGGTTEAQNEERFSPHPLNHLGDR